MVLICDVASARVYRSVDFGISPDSCVVQTERIQSAIDSLSDCGRHCVLEFTRGCYVTGTLQLRDNVELRLDENAVLLGSINPYDYPGYAADADEDNLQVDKCSKRVFGLIVADGVSNVGITGSGMIDGRGLELALAIDSLHHTGERVDPAYNRRRMRPSLRPKLLDIDGVRGLEISDVSLRSSASWGLSLNGCEDVVVRKINFVNRAYWNNDGIDIADCRNVLIDGCYIDSADDGIVLKSFDSDGGNDGIVITNCEICSSANAVKFGTESFGGFRNVSVRNIKVRDTFRSAIALETVDGAVLENVVVDGIDAVNTGNAIFMRLGHRRGEQPGKFRNVTVKNLRCDIPFGRPDADYDLRGPDINVIHNPFPSSITGIPEAHIENVRLENIDITYPGRGTKGMGYIGRYRWHEIPECVDAYPEFHMFGELPAWGFYVRHVDGIVFENVRIRLNEPDYREAIVMDDVSGFVENGFVVE